MKLRNKKTGQLGNFIINKDHFECVDLGYVPEYRNLAELNEEWEDYEEPQGYWYITDYGVVKHSEQPYTDVIDNMARKKIGNYFDTEEEAEKTVEKLKAWRRLRNVGFKLYNWVPPERIYYSMNDLYDGYLEDMDLLFEEVEDA